MDPKLHTFLTLCQTMNYRMAAERLHLSQPAVTKQIQALEQSLQTKLFTYDGHTLHKTEKCLLLERYAISQQYQFEELQLAIADKKRLKLRIGATKTIGDYVLIDAIKISAGSPHHINAMDMVEGYGDGSNPVIDKSEFVLSLFEQLDPRGIDPHEKSIIDRCVDAVYREYKKGGAVPTLRVLRKKLLAQPEEEAQRLALSLELFTSGSLNAFAHETNVDTQNRMVVYDIHDLGRQLKTMGLLVITDAMLNRVTENWRKGKRTHVIVDEFHVVFENEHSAEFFSSAWRRFRKRNAYPTAITQNVEYLLDSVEASTMLSNSEFIVMLNQAASDREKLADKLNISEEQLGYITNAEAGCGLIRYGSALVPFKNRFPKNTELYRLMTTKPGENL